MMVRARGYGLREAITRAVVQEGSIVVVVIMDASADLASLNQLRDDVVATPLVIQLTGDATLTSNSAFINTVQTGAVVSSSPTTPPPSFAPGNSMTAAPTTATPTAVSNTDTGGSSSAGDDGDDGATIAIVVIFAILLIVALVAGAMVYKKKTAAEYGGTTTNPTETTQWRSDGRSPKGPAQDNPAYADSRLSRGSSTRSVVLGADGTFRQGPDNGLMTEHAI